MDRPESEGELRLLLETPAAATYKIYLKKTSKGSFQSTTDGHKEDLNDG